MAFGPTFFSVLALLSLLSCKLAFAQALSPTEVSNVGSPTGFILEALPAPAATSRPTREPEPTPSNSPSPTPSPLPEQSRVLVPQIQRSEAPSQISGIRLELEPVTEASGDGAQGTPKVVKLKIHVEDLKRRLAPSRVKWTQMEPGQFEAQVKLEGSSTPIRLLLVDQLGRVSAETIQIVLKAPSSETGAALSILGRGFQFFLGWKPQIILFNQSLVSGQKTVLAAESGELQMEQLLIRVALPVSRFFELRSHLEFGQSTFSWDPGQLRSPNANADLRLAYRLGLGKVLLRLGMGGGVVVLPYLRIPSLKNSTLAIDSLLIPSVLCTTGLEVSFSPLVAWVLELQGNYLTAASALTTEDRFEAASGFLVRLDTSFKISPIPNSPFFLQGGLGGGYLSQRLEQIAPYSGSHSLQTIYLTGALGGGVKW